MSSDNTRDSRIIHAWEEGLSSENTWLSAVTDAVHSGINPLG